MKSDMTQGSIESHLVRFAIPLILGNMFQLTYNAADSIIVGRFVGNEAQAAVGIANPLMNVLTFFIVGVCNGIGVIISEYFGGKDDRRLKMEMGTATVFGAIIFGALSVVLWAGAFFVLRLIRTPEEILELTGGYLQIIAPGLLFVYLYNLYATALRSMGDARTPLYFLIFSSVLNIFLDLLLVIEFRLGVFGAAAATLISQISAAILCLFYAGKKAEVLRLSSKELRIDKGMLGRTIRYSWATGMQKITLNIGKLLIQSFVNPLGVDVIAAFNAVNRIEDFVLQPEQSIGAAITTFAAQNRGAGKGERVYRSFRVGMVMEILYGAAIGVIIYAGAEPLMTLFAPSPNNSMIPLGISYLHIMSFMYILPGITNGLQGYVRGWGAMNLCLISTFLQIGSRVVFAAFLIPMFGMPGIAYCCLMGWFVMLAYEWPYFVKYKTSRFTLQM
ncbi:MAG: MATE family efflux transporter [Lachnospiraceae bacterium]